MADRTVAVVGLGYVGLPLAVEFAEAGARVIGLDVDEATIAAIGRGESHIRDIPSERLAAVSGLGLELLFDRVHARGHL